MCMSATLPEMQLEKPLEKGGETGVGEKANED